MTEAQRLRLLELVVQAGASPDAVMGYARAYERYILEREADPRALNTLPHNGTSQLDANECAPSQQGARDGSVVVGDDP